MQYLVTMACLWSLTCYAVEITSFDDRGFGAGGLTMEVIDSRTPGFSRMAATENGLPVEEGSIVGRINTTGSLTTASFHWYGPEFGFRYSWNNQTGDVLEDTVTRFLYAGPDYPDEPVPHDTTLAFDLDSGAASIHWVELRAAEPQAFFAIRQIPDSAWSPALLGLGLLGLVIRSSRQ